MDLKGKVVFSSGISVNFDIWCLDLESGSLSQLTYGDNVNDFPRWSPDGRHIAYVSVQEDSIPSLWTMQADGQHKRRLTTNIYCRAPSWSPDGKHLIFAGNATDKTEMEVCTVGLEGGSPERLFTYRGVEKTLSYSPDGHKIIFSAPASENASTLSTRDTEIVQYNVRGGDFQVLCSHPAKDYAPIYSPDGNRFAFISHRNAKSADEYQTAYQEYREILVNGTNAEARAAMVRMRRFEEDGDVFVANSDGSQITQLTHDSGADNGVCWSPCGNYLMYTSASISEHETERLKIIDARSGERIPFSYDRTPLEQEIGSFQFLNATFFQKVVPDSIEKLFVEGSFWGEERRPHWTK